MMENQPTPSPKPAPIVVRPKDEVHTEWYWLALTLMSLAVIGAFGYTYVRVTEMNAQIAMLTQNLSSTSALLYGKTEALATGLDHLSMQTIGISQTLTDTKEDLSLAKNDISAVQGQVGGVAETVGSISGTVTTLQKLSTIDAELLKKYSKVYFLNENYNPAHLSQIPQDSVYSNKIPEHFLSEAYPHLQRLLAAAKAANIVLYVDSGYRSFSTQQQLKSDYRVVYGAGTANAFSADQGYSEHQLGTAVDFITPGLGGDLTIAFADTPAFAWLKANAHKYGFELSYPDGNSYYVYEPWHWRFVGIKLATELHERGMNFYDMDQRDIDAYLASLFD